MTELITPEYQEQLRIKHAKKPWGGGGKSWIPTLEKELNIGEASLVLDYGCGRHTFKEEMAALHPDVEVHEYDPGVPGFDVLPALPQKGGVYDVVVCTDVMEHVEDQFTMATLVTIRDLTGSCVLFNIVTTPCSSTLPDGRNTHINLKPVSEWLFLIALVFKCGSQDVNPQFRVKILEQGGRLVCILRRGNE